VNPQPGFFFGVNGKPAPRDILRNRLHGRIAFANTDLAGHQIIAILFVRPIEQ